MSTISPIACVSKPDGAPGISCDITETHKQVKIRIVAVDGKKRRRPPQCKMCKLQKLKQKKPPFLCVECGDFFVMMLKQYQALNLKVAFGLICATNSRILVLQQEFGTVHLMCGMNIVLRLTKTLMVWLVLHLPLRLVIDFSATICIFSLSSLI